MPAILIAGIGNIFLGDDAFGPEVIRHLEGYDWPPAVAIRDFGIRILDFAWRILDPWDLIILVDAADRGAEPGCVYHVALDPHAPDPDSCLQPFDGHRAGVPDLLRLLPQLAPVAAWPWPSIHLIGCQPQSLEPAQRGGRARVPAVPGPAERQAGRAAKPRRAPRPSFAPLLSPAVAAAVPVAIDSIRSLVTERVTHFTQELIPS